MLKTDSMKGKNMKFRTDDLADLARVFYTLGDKTRLSILTLLAKREMNVQALCNRLALPQSSVSHHLGLLLAGGLVKNRREGKRVFYSHADLSKHRLGRKSRLTDPDINAGWFGPAELILRTRGGKGGK